MKAFNEGHLATEVIKEIFTHKAQSYLSGQNIYSELVFMRVNLHGNKRNQVKHVIMTFQK